MAWTVQRFFCQGVLKADCSSTGTENKRVEEVHLPVPQVARKSGVCIGGGGSARS